MSLNIEWVRQHFPALSGDWVFFDNAGGSQILQPVVDRINKYLLTSNVQHGASYSISQLAQERLAEATRAMAAFINAKNPSEVIMGSSTTMLIRILSICLGNWFKPGDEIIVTNCDHEANIGPWVDLEKQGLKIKFWQINPESLELHLDDLAPLMNKRTRLVAMTHVSNILGTINPIKNITEFVHDHGALICVDGVAYAPHRKIDVQALNVDFYAFSCYKVFGPHHAVMFGKHELLLELPGFNHYFVDSTNIPYKFQPGSVNYELSYGMLGLIDYLDELAVLHSNHQILDDLSKRITYTFELITEYEEFIGARLLDYLNSTPNVHLVGHQTADSQVRVPTISFTVDKMNSASIPPEVDKHNIGIRYGDFHSKRFIKDLGLAENSGVVRVSMAHYNTTEEVDRLIDVFDKIF